MRLLAHTLTRIAPLVLVVSSIAACGAALTAVSGPRTWTAGGQLADGTTRELVVRDESGRLTNAEFDPAGVTAAGISNPPGQPNVVIVPWAAGSCDVRTVFTFKANAQGLTGTFSTTTTGQVCDMLAIEHYLRLTSNAPLPAAQVTLERAP